MNRYTESNVFFLGLLMNIVVDCFTVVQKLIYYSMILPPVYPKIVGCVSKCFCLLVGMILKTVGHRSRSFLCQLCNFLVSCIVIFGGNGYRNFHDPYYNLT